MLMRNNTSGKDDISSDLLNRGDIFVAKFLRSTRGFEILMQRGWIQEKIEYWFRKGNENYIELVEQSMYDSLNLNQVNGQDNDHALSIWIPIYDHSNDLRQELALLKRFPFSLMIKLQGENFDEPI